MWLGIVLKIIGSAIMSVTAVALAAWVLGHREREKSGRPRERNPRNGD